MSRRDEIVTGVFVLVGVAILVVGGVWLSGDRLGKNQRVLTARFADVGQLQVGNAVTVRGVNVGTVDAIAFADEGHVRVRMRLRGDVPLPPEPVAVLSASSLFGDWQAALVPGDRRPEALVDTARLSEDEIPGITLSDFAELSDHTSEIADNLRGITDQLQIAFNEETAGQLAGAIQNVNRASGHLVEILESQRALLDTLSGDVQAMGADVRAASSSLRATLARIDSATTGGRLDSIAADARRGSRALADLGEEWRRAGERLHGTLARADSTLAEAEALLATMNRGEGTLGRLAADELLYENTAAAVAELRALLDDLKRDPGKYFRVSIF